MTRRPRRARGNPPGSPWAGGPERLPDGAPARNTVRVALRLQPEEAAALEIVAATDHRGIASRAVGAAMLARAAEIAEET